MDYEDRFYTLLSENDTLHSELESLRAQLASVTSERDELRQFHDSAMIQLAKLVDKDISDEPRFKWVYLVISSKLSECRKVALLEAAEKLESFDGWITSESASYAVRLMAEGK